MDTRQGDVTDNESGSSPPSPIPISHKVTVEDTLDGSPSHDNSPSDHTAAQAQTEVRLSIDVSATLSAGHDVGAGGATHSPLPSSGNAGTGSPVVVSPYFTSALTRQPGPKAKEVPPPPPYDSRLLTWNKLHTRNSKNRYCYCGEERTTDEINLQCEECRNWFHQHCVGVSLDGLMKFSLNYQFLCRHCAYEKKGEEESLHVVDASWKNVLQTTLANLINDKGPGMYHLKDDIVPFMDTHWDILCRGRSRTNTWWETCRSKLLYSPELFSKEMIKGQGFRFNLVVGTPLDLRAVPLSIAGAPAQFASSKKKNADDQSTLGSMDGENSVASPMGGLKRPESGGGSTQPPKKKRTRAWVTRGLQGGYPTKQFPKSVRQNLSPLNCELCQHVAREPVQCACTHASPFCRECITAYLSRHPTCPCPSHEPMSVSSLQRPEPSFMRLWSGMKVFCENRSQGCRVIPLLSTLPAHQSMCPFTVVKCMYAGCDFAVERVQMASHQQTCAHRDTVVHCSKCGQDMPAHRVDGHPCLFPCNYCKQEMPSHLLITHPSVCTQLPRPCPVFDCPEKAIIPHNLANHILSSPQSHMLGMLHMVMSIQAEVGALRMGMERSERSLGEAVRGAEFWRSLAVSIAKAEPESDDTQKTYRCQACQATFTTASNLIDHSLSAHYTEGLAEPWKQMTSVKPERSTNIWFPPTNEGEYPMSTTNQNGSFAAPPNQTASVPRGWQAQALISTQGASSQPDSPRIQQQSMGPKRSSDPTFKIHQFLGPTKTRSPQPAKFATNTPPDFQGSSKQFGQLPPPNAKRIPLGGTKFIHYQPPVYDNPPTNVLRSFMPETSEPVAASPLVDPAPDGQSNYEDGEGDDNYGTMMDVFSPPAMQAALANQDEGVVEQHLNVS